MAIESLHRQQSLRRGVAGRGVAGRERGDVDGEVESLKEQARSTHEEARMVLPGIQVLFGFQLIAVFNRPFFDLAPVDQMLHLAALVLVATAIGLIMAPAAHHRLIHPDVITRAWIRHAARDIAWAMAALLVAIGLDVHVVAMMIVGGRGPAVGLGIAVCGLLGWLWFAQPLFVRGRGRPGLPGSLRREG